MMRRSDARIVRLTKDQALIDIASRARMTLGESLGRIEK
jgi:hypothetical protein